MSFSSFTPEQVELDTGIATSLTARPSVFTPPGTASTITAPLDTGDAGQSSQVVSRPNTFDAASATDTPDPGY